MKISPEKMQKAKKILKKYNFWRFGLFIAFACVIISSAIAFELPLFALIVLVAALTLRIGISALGRKIIMPVLLREFDPETYLALVCQGKLDSPACLIKLDGEYFCGNYQNVIHICKAKLADPRFAKKHKYRYWIYLANVYFDIGDDENLRLVCEQYNASLETEPPSKQVKIRNTTARMPFYDMYLKQDMDACTEWANTPTPLTINQYQRNYCKAKLALLQGKEEIAREHCRDLAATVPNFNYGKLAAKLLEKADGREEGCYPLRLTELVEAEVEIDYEPFYPFRKRLLVCIAAVAIALVLYLVALSVLNHINFMKAKAEYEEQRAKEQAEYEEQRAKEQAAYAEYVESIRLLVEEDYDGVEVLDTFTLKDGEDVVDTMFICRTDTHFVVGCIYTHKGESTPRYKTQVAVPIEDLSEYYYIQYFPFTAVTSDYQIISYLYTDQSNVPSDSRYSFTCVENGHVVGYIVTDIKPIP